MDAAAFYGRRALLRTWGFLNAKYMGVHSTFARARVRLRKVANLGTSSSHPATRAGGRLQLGSKPRGGFVELP